MNTADFDYHLPAELIAQSPLEQRDASRLMRFDRASSHLTHSTFRHLLDQVAAGDVWVFNNSAVIPARLRGLKPSTGGEVELLLLESASPSRWWCLAKPGKRLRQGVQFQILAQGTRHANKANPSDSSRDLDELSGWKAEVKDKNSEGHCLIEFSHPTGRELLKDIEHLGETPLPPYIRRGEEGPGDRHRYQTVFATEPGSVAAPTAGLHFTEAFRREMHQRGAILTAVTLHVGLGTFSPVKTEELSEHSMHSERYWLPSKTAEAIRQAKAAGNRIVAVGTTSLRVLESAARQHAGFPCPASGSTRLFLYPPAEFLVVDALLTNFHLPCSTLLMLVSAFAAPGKLDGRERVLNAYREAIAHRYRFFSYGDAMFIH